MSEQLVQAHRARRTKGQESISRDMLQTRSLTLKARGLLAMVESLPDDWECHGIEGLAAMCDHDGYTAVSNAVKELEAHGYWARMKRQGGGGKWEWLWTYSDDPRDVDEEVAEWEAKGFKAINRGGPRRPAVNGTAGRKASAAMSRKPQHGGVEVSATVSRFSEHGSPEHGSSTFGEPPDIESDSTENPPNPPQGGGDEVSPPREQAAAPEEPERCSTHGRQRCRPCGISPRVQARAERERTAAELLAEAGRGDACPMCRRDGARADGSIRFVRVEPGTPHVLTPYIVCDHETSLEVVRERLAAAEAAAEAARVSRSAPGPRMPSPDARAAALAAARPRRVREAGESVGRGV